jgi:hypothetical protein
MIRLGWKDKLHAYVAGRLLGKELFADEGHVTQLLEMGQSTAVTDFDRNIHDLYLGYR